MEILCFKIKGKFAHFRKYFANNTAFSFTIPPRTSIMGMLAAALGWEKDSYYEKMNSENLRIGVKVLTHLKKNFHRVNFLRIGSNPQDFRGVSSRLSDKSQTGPIQTPFEVISAWDIAKKDVEYQIFISYQEKGKEIFENIKNLLINRAPIYNISLGTANFTASIFDIIVVCNDKIKEKKSDDFILMNSALPAKYVEELKFDKEEYDSYNFVEEDMMPGDFVGNNNREVRKMNKLLFSTTPNPLRVKFSEVYYEVQLPTETINLQFMDL